MSFGFGISDIITLYQLTERLCMSFKNAPNEFSEISRQLDSLHIVLTDLKAQVEDPNSLLNRQVDKSLELSALQGNLVATMKELEGIYEQYQQAGSFRSRFSLGLKDLAPVRSKLNLQISAINTFVGVMNMAALGRMEPMLERICAVVADRAKGNLDQVQTILSAATENEDVEDGSSWTLLEVELRSEGIPLEYIQENKIQIKEVLRNIVRLYNLDASDRSTIYAEDSVSQVGHFAKRLTHSSYSSGPLIAKLPVLKTWVASRRILPYQEWLRSLSSEQEAARIKLLKHGFDIQNFGPTNPSRFHVFKGLPKHNQLQESAVCWAATKGGEVALKMLLDRGCSPSSSQRDESAILRAAQAGNWDIVRLLLKSGADIHAGYVSMSSQIGLLQTAVAANQCDILALLLRKGIKPDMCCKVAQKVYTTCSIGDKKVDLTWTALHLAARNCSLEAAEHLVNKGADVNKTTYDGYTPLGLATTSAILSARSSKTTANIQHEQTLVQRHRNIITLLLKNGTDINANICYPPDIWEPLLLEFFPKLTVDRLRTYKGMPPLYLVVISQNLGLAKFLLNSGADANAQWDWDFKDTPLYLAVRGRQYDMVKLLLDSGSHVNSISSTRKKQTALHLAVKLDQYKIVKILVDFGADANIENSRGDTPMTLAKHSKNVRISNFFSNLQKK